MMVRPVDDTAHHHPARLHFATVKGVMFVPVQPPRESFPSRSRVTPLPKRGRGRSPDLNLRCLEELIEWMGGGRGGVIYPRRGSRRFPRPTGGLLCLASLRLEVEFFAVRGEVARLRL